MPPYGLSNTNRDWSAILGSDFSIKSPTLNSAGKAIEGAGKVAGSNIPYMAIANQIMTDIDDYKMLSDDSNVRAYINQLNGMNNALWNADFGSSEDILQAHRFNNPDDASYVDEHRTTGQKLATLGKDTVSGAALGTSIMPGIGTAIGAAAGFLGGAVKNAWGDVQADRKQERAEKAFDIAELNRGKALKYGIDTYNTKNSMLQDFNYSDMGGPLNHGTHWNDNIILVDAGGTHETNPYGGVLMGMDEQGTPNLVEEGETIYNDYVYSNRLKVPRGLRNKYKFGGKKPMSYSEFIKESPFFKAIEEMPNDPNVRRSFESFLGELAMSQEEVRAKDAIKQQSNRFDWGGFLDALKKYTYSTQRGGIAGTYKIDPNMHKSLGFKTIKDLEDSKMYNAFTDYVLNNSENENVLNYLRTLDEGTHKDVEKLFDTKTGKLKSNWKELYAGSDGRGGRRYDQKGGIYHFSGLGKTDLANILIGKEHLNIASNNAGLDNIGLDIPDMSGIDEYFNNPENIKTNPVKTRGKTDLTPLRYAPIAGNVAAWFDMLANPIDYSNIERYENYAMGLPMATTHPIGNYTEYRPFDINYAANRARSQSGGRERLISDLSGGNAASARASLVANGFNEQNTVGDLLLAGAESNLKQRQFRDTFNRETDKYNSEDAFRTQNANIGIWNTKLNALVRSAAETEALDARYSAAKSANRTALAENLGNLGREEFIFNQLDNPALMYEYARGIFGNRSGQVSYKSGSKGGLLTVKRKGRK